MSDFEDDPVIDPFSPAYGEGKDWQQESDDSMAMLGGVAIFMLAFLITVGVALYVWVF